MKGIIYKYTSPSGKSIAKAAKDNEMDRNWLAKFVKGKDNYIFRGFMWKEVHDA